MFTQKIEYFAEEPIRAVLKAVFQVLFNNVSSEKAMNFSNNVKIEETDHSNEELTDNEIYVDSCNLKEICENWVSELNLEDSFLDLNYKTIFRNAFHNINIIDVDDYNIYIEPIKNNEILEIIDQVADIFGMYINEIELLAEDGHFHGPIVSYYREINSDCLVEIGDDNPIVVDDWVDEFITILGGNHPKRVIDALQEQEVLDNHTRYIINNEYASNLSFEDIYEVVEEHYERSFPNGQGDEYKGVCKKDDTFYSYIKQISFIDGSADYDISDFEEITIQRRR